jgi:hypothetical protein
MIKKIKKLFLVTTLAGLLAVPIALPATTLAAHGGAHIQQGLCKGADELSIGLPTGEECKELGRGEGANTGSLNRLITQIINIISVIVAIVAVIMLIFGGFRYITSGGASDKVKGAKDTILYALIGLVIVALAQTVVKFVVNKLTA